jgi:hypothetical protein
MKTIPLFISDDHAALHEVLQLPLVASDDIEIVSEAENRHRPVSEIRIFQPEIVPRDTAPSLNEVAGSSPGSSNGHGSNVATTKRILRHKWTGLYFAPKGGWVSDWRQAMHISDPTDLLATCKAHESPQIEFILKFEADECDDILDERQAAEAQDCVLFNERYGFEEFFASGPGSLQRKRLFQSANRLAFIETVAKSKAPLQINGGHGVDQPSNGSRAIDGRGIFQNSRQAVREH